MRGLRWSKVKICVTTTIYTHTGGLIRLYIVIWSVLSQFKWLLLFLHHAWRGHGARLSIRTKDPNNHSDTETGTLSICDILSLCETRFLLVLNCFVLQNINFLENRVKTLLECRFKEGQWSCHKVTDAFGKRELIAQALQFLFLW